MVSCSTSKAVTHSLADKYVETAAMPSLLHHFCCCCCYHCCCHQVPAVGSCPPRLINLTLTHCPTYSFDFWGSEATFNMARVAAFRCEIDTSLIQQMVILEPTHKVVWIGSHVT